MSPLSATSDLVAWLLKDRELDLLSRIGILWGFAIVGLVIAAQLSQLIESPPKSWAALTQQSR